MGRKTQNKMRHNRMIAIKDIPNAIQGWYKASITLAKKVENYKKKLTKIMKKHEETKIQLSMDSLFKEYIRINYRSIYWETVRYMSRKNLKTSKEYGRATEELKTKLG